MAPSRKKMMAGLAIAALGTAATVGAVVAVKKVIENKKRKEWVARTYGIIAGMDPEGTYGRLLYTPSSTCTALGGKFNKEDDTFGLCDCHINIVKGSGAGLISGKEDLIAMSSQPSPGDLKKMGLALGGDGKQYLSVNVARDSGKYRLARVDDPSEPSSPRIKVAMNVLGDATKAKELGADLISENGDGWITIAFILSKF